MLAGIFLQAVSSLSGKTWDSGTLLFASFVSSRELVVTQWKKQGWEGEKSISAAPCMLWSWLELNLIFDSPQHPSVNPQCWIIWLNCQFVKQRRALYCCSPGFSPKDKVTLFDNVTQFNVTPPKGWILEARLPYPGHPLFCSHNPLKTNPVTLAHWCIFLTRCSRTLTFEIYMVTDVLKD